MQTTSNNLGQTVSVALLILAFGSILAIATYVMSQDTRDLFESMMVELPMLSGFIIKNYLIVALAIFVFATLSTTISIVINFLELSTIIKRAFLALVFSIYVIILIVVVISVYMPIYSLQDYI